MIVKLLEELKSDVEIGKLTLDNLNSEERSNLKNEIVSIRSRLEPMNTLLKTLNHYTECYHDVYEMILGGNDVQIPSDEDISLSLEHSKDIIDLINFIQKDQPDGSTNPRLMNLISSATITDHVDQFIKYLRSLNCK